MHFDLWCRNFISKEALFEPNFCDKSLLHLVRSTTQLCLLLRGQSNEPWRQITLSSSASKCNKKGAKMAFWRVTTLPNLQAENWRIKPLCIFWVLVMVTTKGSKFHFLFSSFHLLLLPSAVLQIILPKMCICFHIFLKIWLLLK